MSVALVSDPSEPEVFLLPIDPEKELRILFRREAQLERQLREVRAGLDRARTAYAAASGCMANPRLELLRTRFAPASGSARKGTQQ